VAGIVTPAAAERAAAGVGLATLLIGGALTVAPVRVGAMMGLTDPRGARIVGLADLALVPGLIRGRPVWPWVAARGSLNLAIVAYGLALDRRDRRVRLAAAALIGATVGDAVVLATLRRADH